MKLLFFSAFIFIAATALPQNIQLHWDFRHTINPELNPKNFPSFTFEYFKGTDSCRRGSFQFKLDSRLDGKNSNTGQVFTQISQSVKFWKPKFYLSVTYSGGLGVTQASFGYYLSNSIGIGPSYTFQCYAVWISASGYLRANFFDKPSYDPQITLWLGTGFFNYKINISGSFVCWSQNRNQGDDTTKDLSGKKVAFFGDPQIWFKIMKGFSAGSRINVYYHLLNEENQIQLYPTLGVKYEF